MKNRIFIALFGAVLSCCLGCVEQDKGEVVEIEKSKYSRFDNPDQNMLDSLVDYYYEADKKTGGNKLAEEELLEEYYARLTNFFDSVKIENWRARMSEIEIVFESMDIDNVPYRMIRLKLYDDSNHAPYIDYGALYYVKVDSLNTDSTYNALRKCRRGDIVYFSGDIEMYEAEGRVLLNACDPNIQMAHPTLHIKLTKLTRREEN